MAPPSQDKYLSDLAEILKMPNANMVHSKSRLPARATKRHGISSGRLPEYPHAVGYPEDDIKRVRTNRNCAGAKHWYETFGSRPGRGFLNLAPEVRNIIYHMVLVRNNTIAVGSVYHLEDNLAALLCTCKTIEAEARGIVYSQKFEFYGIAALESFLTKLRPSTMSYLRHLSIKFCGATSRHRMPPVYALLTGAHNLETLEMDIFMRLTPSPWSHPGMSVSDWDASLAGMMAEEMYRPLSTYLGQAVPARGINKVMGILDATLNRNFMDNSDRRIRAAGRNIRIRGEKWTEERKVAIKNAVGEQILSLVERDSH